MDAIVKLPPSSNYDSIMVFVDRFIKQAHFVPYTEKGFDAPDLATMFRLNIMRLHGIPQDIVSDRGSISTLQFWRAFVTQLGIIPNFSTAFHPQSDGQTERVNQVIEHYLWTYCNHNQDNWSSLLDLAEFSYNNAVHSTTQHSPFEANYVYHPMDPSSTDQVPSNQVPAATSHLDHLRTLHRQLKENITKARDTQARFFNRHAASIDIDEVTPRFKIGDKVYLNRKHITSLRPSLKLENQPDQPIAALVGEVPHVTTRHGLVRSLLPLCYHVDKSPCVLAPIERYPSLCSTRSHSLVPRRPMRYFHRTIPTTS